MTRWMYKEADAEIKPETLKGYGDRNMFQTAPMANERNGKSTAMCHTLSANAGGKLGQTFADRLTFLSDAWPGQLLATD